MTNTTSQHILSTSANLLGFCLFVITSLHINNHAESSFIDEFTSMIALILIFSCLFSFISLRTKSLTKEYRMESIAEYLFVTSLFGILIIIVLIFLNYIK